MDYQLTDDQRALVAALQDILQDHAVIPQDKRLGFAWHDASLQNLLADSGFLDAARDIGPLEGALVIYEAAKNIGALDTIGSGLVAPLLMPDRRLVGPVALVARGDIDKAIRNLPIAQNLLVDCGNDVVLLSLDSMVIDPVDSILAYPYGRFSNRPNLSLGARLTGAGPAMRQWWRVGLAAEVAGAAEAALDFTLDYVKQRNVFGRPVGSFQAVQHRLVQRYGWVKSLYFLAMKAAWSADDGDAAIAACFAQVGIQSLMFDLHQFHGGMGVTTEYLLHFWSYRIRAVQSEVGGLSASSLAIANRRWASAMPAGISATLAPVAGVSA